jgi:hypothetical protein
MLNEFTSQMPIRPPSSTHEEHQKKQANKLKLYPPAMKLMSPYEPNLMGLCTQGIFHENQKNLGIKAIFN